MRLAIQLSFSFPMPALMGTAGIPSSPIWNRAREHGLAMLEDNFKQMDESGVAPA